MLDAVKREIELGYGIKLSEFLHKHLLCVLHLKRLKTLRLLISGFQISASQLRFLHFKEH